jgi:hypothetical protein
MSSARSTIMAIPWPAPMHVVARPWRTSGRRCISWTGVVGDACARADERVAERHRGAVDVQPRIVRRHVLFVQHGERLGGQLVIARQRVGRALAP